MQAKGRGRGHATGAGRAAAGRVGRWPTCRFVTGKPFYVKVFQTFPREGRCLVLHFTFFDRDGRRICRVEETGYERSVRAPKGPPMLVARVFGMIGALTPEDFARLQRAASARGEVQVAVKVLRPELLPKTLRPPGP